MLIQFKTKNFLSFKEEVVVLFKKNNALKGLDDNCLNNEYLSTIAIYGANASGKSNLMKAITAAILAVRDSNKRQINEPLKIIPFLFDNETKKQPSFFEFTFIAKNGIKYIYGFKADNIKVYEEYLYGYFSQKPSMIFERKDVNKYEYAANNISQLSQYELKNSDNKLFLSTATSWGSELTKDAYLWFAESIDTYESSRLDGYIPILLDSKDDNLKGFLINFLKEADINISNYDFEVHEFSEEEKNLISKKFNINFETMPPSYAKGYKLNTEHTIIRDNKKEKYIMRIDSESLGTIKLFAYGPIIKSALDKGKTIFVDEIDNCLHTKLVRHLINLFHDKSINKNNAQLIFVTNNVNLLDLNFIRRDQIYFVEKNYNLGTSELFSLDDFSVLKKENIRKEYLCGRFGAIPNIE